MLWTAAVALVAISQASAYVIGYRVEPLKSRWSVWTKSGDTISQSMVCDFDSLLSVELFVGGAATEVGGFHVDVYDGRAKLASASGAQWQPNGWILFQNWSNTAAFAKGRQLTFRFTRGDRDSTHYYCDHTDPYRYGSMSNNIGQNSFDLCMRVFGKRKPVDRTWWGYQTWARGDTHVLTQHGIPTKARNAGVGMARVLLNWPDIWKDRYSVYDFSSSDAELAYARTTLGCKIIGLLAGTPKWASSRTDSAGSCPPLYLDSAATDSDNYWYRYVQGVVTRYDSMVNVWEIWNEPNDTAGFWRIPDTYYTIGEDTARCMSELYARLCVVAESAIRSVAARDTILIGSLVRPQAGLEHPRIDPVGMLRCCYEYGEGAGWNGVSAHYYTDPDGVFVPSTFDAYAESLRMAMRDNGDYGTLWLTETGWPLHPDSSEPARYLCKAFTTAAGTDASPWGGYDAACYYCFREDHLHFGVLDASDDTSRPAYFAACQTAAALTGRRFNRRMMAGDTAVDNHVRMFEFEDMSGKRTWVCWRNGDAKQGVNVKLPVRTNSLAAESLAYSRTPPRSSPRVADNGWLPVNLNTRPVFISEKTAPERPDLGVDSVRVVQSSPVVVRAWVTNHGNRATPARSGLRTGYPTRAVLRAEGDSVTQATRTSQIGVNQQVAFSFDISRASLPDTALVSVEVNPGQAYVELGMDDNIGYTLAVKR